MWLHNCNLSSTLTPVNIHQYISYQQLDYQWKFFELEKNGLNI